MAHFLRGKQAGVQKDFSAGLDPRFFAIDQVRHYMFSHITIRRADECIGSQIWRQFPAFGHRL